MDVGIIKGISVFNTKMDKVSTGDALCL